MVRDYPSGGVPGLAIIHMQSRMSSIGIWTISAKIAGIQMSLPADSRLLVVIFLNILFSYIARIFYLKKTILTLRVRKATNRAARLLKLHRIEHRAPISF